VLIPDEVASELADSGAPPVVADWARHLPAWVEIRATPASSEPLKRIDAGERAAIILAEAQQSPVLLLMDDAEGRAEAERRRIPVTGTLGVLRAAALRDLVDLPGALARLRMTNFRCPSSLLDELIAEDGERKRSKRKK
jgi:predicted nucleic acid-binding protein